MENLEEVQENGFPFIYASWRRKDSGTWKQNVRSTHWIMIPGCHSRRLNLRNQILLPPPPPPQLSSCSCPSSSCFRACICSYFCSCASFCASRRSCCSSNCCWCCCWWWWEGRYTCKSRFSWFRLGKERLIHQKTSCRLNTVGLTVRMNRTLVKQKYFNTFQLELAQNM